MAISGISAANSYAPSRQPVPSLGPHKHGGHHSHAAADVDVMGSSAAPAKGSTGMVGSKINIRA